MPGSMLAHLPELRQTGWMQNLKAGWVSTQSFYGAHLPCSVGLRIYINNILTSLGQEQAASFHFT